MNIRSPKTRARPGSETAPTSFLGERSRLGLIQLQALLVIAILLGGGGAAYGMRNLAVQLFALAILALNVGQVLKFLREAPRSLLLLVVASMALPLLQTVPLPPAVWQAFPGRDPVVESFSIAELGAGRWFSHSVNPVRTLVAFSGTLAPAALIILGYSLDQRDRLLLAWTVVAGAFAAFLIGTVQLSTGNTYGLLFHERSTPDILYATFANRNSTGLFFVLALCLLCGMPLSRNRVILGAKVAAGILLLIGVILTQSRTGITLVIIPLGLLTLRFWLGFKSQSHDTSRGRAALWLGVGLAAVVIGSVAVSSVTGGRAADSFARFATTMETDRPEMWEDGIYAAGQYWPVGSGMGSFDDVFQMHKSLEYVSPRRAGRAHNDYIELAIESGIIGLSLAALWLLWCAFPALKAGPAADRFMRFAAGSGVAAIALQSLLDYPLRNQTLLCVAAVLVVLLARPGESQA